MVAPGSGETPNLDPTIVSMIDSLTREQLIKAIKILRQDTQELLEEVEAAINKIDKRIA